ncbi:MAG TPA: hypothetical protein PKM82_10585 [Acidovorax sp.]|nr:hypothetical protein [Acidovorax sp.]
MSTKNAAFYYYHYVFIKALIKNSRTTLAPCPAPGTWPQARPKNGQHHADLAAAGEQDREAGLRQVEILVKEMGGSRCSKPIGKIAQGLNPLCLT